MITMPASLASELSHSDDGGGGSSGGDTFLNELEELGLEHSAMSTSQRSRGSIMMKRAPKRQTSADLKKGSLTFVGKFINTNFRGLEVDYRWEQLKHIEERRRNILEHVDEPLWKIMTYYDGTVTRILVYDVLFWCTILIYVGIRMVSYWELPAYLSDMPVDSITVLGGFVTFFLVFWVNQSHVRFFGLYGHSMGIKGCIFSAATLGATSLPPEKAARLVRYMNCAHAAAYVGLSDVYTTSNYFNAINRQMGLLTEQERDRLDHIDIDKGGSCARELVAWCMNEIHTAERQGLINQILAKDFRDQVLGVQSHIGQLFNAKDLPIPFFYVHFICLLTTLYLPLFAVTAAIQAGQGQDTGWINSLIRGVTVVLQSVFVIGLRVLGQKMSDPYGDDLIDLSVMYYVHFTWQMSNRILNSHFPEEANVGVEETLCYGRENLGDAWEPTREEKQRQEQKPVKRKSNPRKSFYYDASENVSPDVEAGEVGSEYRTVRNPHPGHPRQAHF